MSVRKTYRVDCEGVHGVGHSLTFQSQPLAYGHISAVRTAFPKALVTVWVREAGSDRWDLYEILETGDGNA